MTLEHRNSGLSPAVASATLNWPWGWAVGGGVAAGAINLVTNLPATLLGAVPEAVSVGIFFFALVGGTAMFLRSKGDRRARRYTGSHPWQVALVPAGVGGAGVALVSYIGAALSGSLVAGLFGALALGIGAGAVLWLMLGLIAMVAGKKSS